MARKNIFYLSPADAQLVVQAFFKRGIYHLSQFDAQWMAHLGAGIYAVENGGVLYMTQITHYSDGGIDCQVDSFRHHFNPASFKHNGNGETCLSAKNAKLVAEAFLKRGFSQVSFLGVLKSKCVNSKK